MKIGLADFELANTRLATVEQWNLGLSAGAVAASFAFATPLFATSLAAGAFLEAINLGAIHRAARRLFAGEMLSRGWVGGFAIRFLALGAAIYLTMTAGAHPVAFLVGLSIAMPATLIDGWINRPEILDPATLPTFLDEDESADELIQTPSSEKEDLALLQIGDFFSSMTSIFSVRTDDDVLDDVLDANGQPIPSEHPDAEEEESER